MDPSHHFHSQFQILYMYSLCSIWHPSVLMQKCCSQSVNLVTILGMCLPSKKEETFSWNWKIETIILVVIVSSLLIISQCSASPPSTIVFFKKYGFTFHYSLKQLLSVKWPLVLVYLICLWTNILVVKTYMSIHYKVDSNNTTSILWKNNLIHESTGICLFNRDTSYTFNGKNA